VDATAPFERERVLARLAVALAAQLGDYARAVEAINCAMPSIGGGRK